MSRPRRRHNVSPIKPAPQGGKPLNPSKHAFPVLCSLLVGQIDIDENDFTKPGEPG